MNFKKMKKRFFSLSRGNGGFTLVELIVVIAILAILGCVAVPAYSGYVEKAKLAGDEQLLAAVNTAFAAACAENGTDTYNVPETPSITLSGEAGAKTIEEGAITSPTGYDAAFQRYFAGNEGSKFKVFESLYFSRESHMFQADEAISLEYGDGYITILRSDAEKLDISTFITADGLGVEGLLNKVDEVATFAALLNDSRMDDIFNSSAFAQTAASVLGLDANDPNLYTNLNDELDRLGAELMAKDSSITDLNEAKNRIKANAAVMMAAQSAVKQDPTSIKTLLTGTDIKGDIVKTMNSNTATGMSQAALAYGMYTAYAYSTGNAELIESTKDPVNILNGLQDEGFQKYITNADGGEDQAAKDLEGYMSALNMINGSTNDKDAVSKVLVNGFNDPALVALLQQTLATSK